MAGDNYRTRRTALTLASSVFVSGATILIAFVTTPLLLRWLGTERFGAVRAASDWFGHLTILELGIGGAVAPLLALALGRGDADATRNTMAEAIRSFLRVAGMAVGAGLVITLCIGRLVPVSPALLRDLQFGCLLGVAGLLVYPFAPFRTLADAAQRGYLANLFGFARSLVSTGLAVLFAWYGLGITGQFAALLGGSVLFTALITRDGLRRLPGVLGAAVRGPRDDEARHAIRRLNLPSLLFDLSARAGLLTDNVVIALVLGPSAVVPLFLTQRLVGLAQQQIQGVGSASWAALGELHALGRQEVFNARLIELTRLVSALCVIALVPLAAFNHAFIGLWIGEGQFGGHAVTILATLNAFLLSLVSLWGWCLTGTGQVRALVPVMLIGAALNVALSVAGAFVWGIPGPLLGTAVAITTTTLWYIPVRLRISFGVSALALARAAIGPVLWGIVPAAGIAFVARRYPPATWPALAVAVAASGLVLLLVWWFGELNGEERGHYLERVRMVRR